MQIGVIFPIIFVFGGLSLFFFGVKVLSNRQQELLEVPIHNVLTNLGGHKIKALWKGVLFSLLSCSSMASSSTVAGMAGAGLIKLRTALSLVLGANVGAPLLTLILALLHPAWFPEALFLGLLPYLFSKGLALRDLGGIMFGLGMMLLGLNLMVEALGLWQEFALTTQILNILSTDNTLGHLAALFLGLLLSTLVRSSLISLGPFFALGMVEGLSPVNGLYAVVGINLAGVFSRYTCAERANTFGRRVAKGNSIHNLLGAVFMLTLSGFVTSDFWLWHAHSLPINLSLYHIVFNLIPMILLAIGIETFSKLVTHLAPGEEMGDEYELEAIGSAADMIPAMALTQARFHLLKLKELVDRLFSLVREYITNDEINARKLAKIKDYERITDNMRQEIEGFLHSLIQGPLSPRQAQQVQRLSRVAQEFENIADYLDKLASYNTRFRENAVVVIENKQELVIFFDQVRSFHNQITEMMDESGGIGEVDYSKRFQLKEKAEELREKHLKRITSGHEEALALMSYSDMMVCLRKIRGHSLKLANAYRDAI